MALVAISVGLTVLAFPPVAAWPLGALMHAPLAAGLEGRRPAAAAGLGLGYLLAVGLGVAHWMVHALAVEYGVPAPAAWLFTAVVIAAVTLPTAAALGLYAALRPRVRGVAAPLLFAACFTAGEWVRAIPLACPWVLPGHALAPAPLWLQSADLFGAAGVGFGVSLVGASLGIAATLRRAAPLAPAALWVAAAAGYGAWRLAAPLPEGPTPEVAVVQAAVPQHERFRPGSALRNTARHAALTRELVAEARPDLVVWSETAVDTDLDASPALRAGLEALVDATGVPLVTGAPRQQDGHPINAVVAFVPGGGLVRTYAKQVLVPFAESDPAWGGPLAPLVRPLTEGAGYAAGTEATVFRVGPLPFATPVCFEITYPGLIRRFRREGARLLVNLSNDAWFGPGGYGEIHFLQAVFRAVEFRTWVVRGANTGISGVVDPRGRTVVTLPLFEEGSLRARVGPAGAPTPYQRAGELPALGLVGLALALALGPGRCRAGSAGSR